MENLYDMVLRELAANYRIGLPGLGPAAVWRWADELNGVLRGRGALWHLEADIRAGMLVAVPGPPPQPPVPLYRPYVIACNEHAGNWPGCLLFWGRRTGDDEKRSFGGYSTDIEKCERYSRMDIERFRGDIPFYDPGMAPKAFRSHPDIAIRVDELKDLGLSTARVWYAP